MKKLILILASIIFIAGAGAIQEGDILTQTQIDNINFDTVSLQCNYTGLTIYLNYGVFYFNFSCLSLQPVNNSRYMVIRQPLPQTYYILEYLQCRILNSKSYCVTETRNTILDFFRRDKLSLRDYLKSYQTKNPDVNGSDFDFGELN